MGYYMWMGRTPNKMPIKKQELYDFIEAKPWSVIDDEDNGPEPSFFYTPWGMIRVMDKAPADGSVQSSWLNIRLSSATKEFPQALQFYLDLAHELDMDLFNSRRVVTTENFMTAVKDFNNASALIERLFGHHEARKKS